MSIALMTHARTELKDYLSEHANRADRLMANQVLELLEVLASHNHKDINVGVVLDLFSRLARYGVLSPLTGEESEWNMIDRSTYQNKRCSHVFKGTTGPAYDIHGKVFNMEDASTYSTSESYADIEFPYTPHTEIINTII